MRFASKPFEITVLDSTGDKAFEQAAIHALQHGTMEPGTVNGKPNESASRMKFVFRLSDPSPGAAPAFVATYRKLLKAIAASDQPAADAAVRELKITNLYEDAFYGLARYYYAQRWGTKSEQLSALRRAIANEKSANYLPKGDFQAALIASFGLEVATRRYGEALNSWRQLQKMHLEPQREAQIRSVVEQLKTLQTDTRAYEISDVMPQGSMSIDLFKRHFRVELTSGHVSVIKLYCTTQFVSFVFDPTLEYSVKHTFGDCRMEMLGDPGTEFTLVQF